MKVYLYKGFKIRLHPETIYSVSIEDTRGQERIGIGPQFCDPDSALHAAFEEVRCVSGKGDLRANHRPFVLRHRPKGKRQ